MRAFGLAACIALAACTSAAPSGQPGASPSAVGECRLPVLWSVNVVSPPGVDFHSAFVRVPDGSVNEVGVLPQLPQKGYGTSYDSASRKWLGADRRLVSPDATRYAYWTSSELGTYEVRIVDIATGADRVVYSGSTLYIVIAFGSEAIYLVHGINPRQGAFEKLYRLDPMGGTPTLVPGSDRHMYQYGWVLVADGAAWGIDYRVQGSDYSYSVVRLDLATNQVTQWLESQPTMFWPLGVDGKHKLYVGDNQQQLWRVGPAGQVDRLANPGPVTPSEGIGGSSGFVSDSLGVWIAGQGSVWLYSEDGAPKHFVVGPPGEVVWPVGPCL